MRRPYKIKRQHNRNVYMYVIGELADVIFLFQGFSRAQTEKITISDIDGVRAWIDSGEVIIRQIDKKE